MSRFETTITYKINISRENLIFPAGNVGGKSQ